MMQGKAETPDPHQTRLALLRLTGRALLDAVDGIFGREPLHVPLVGERGMIAALTTPDVRDTARALHPDNRHPEWQRTVAARSAQTRLLPPRPTRFPRAARCSSSSATTIARLFPIRGLSGTARASRGARLPARRASTALLGGHEQAVQAQFVARASAPARRLAVERPPASSSSAPAAKDAA